MNHLYKNSMRREYSVVGAPYFPWMTPSVTQLAIWKSHYSSDEWDRKVAMTQDKLSHRNRGAKLFFFLTENFSGAKSSHVREAHQNLTELCVGLCHVITCPDFPS